MIVVAGATGNLGHRIVKELVSRGAHVQAIVRKNSSGSNYAPLEELGVKIVPVDMRSIEQIASACREATVVVSALSGFSEVILGIQKNLLEAAVKAGVPRFIPSDFSLDFTHLQPGRNRNLDLRRQFHVILDKYPIEATTIFNGAFMDLLTAEMPMILSNIHRILYWGNADQTIDFTTMDNTAAFTASAAMSSKTPRYLKIAGDRLSPRTMAAIVSDITHEKYKLFRPGGIGLLNMVISATKVLAPAKKELYPAWQGMQYMRDMMEGKAVIEKYDNDRFKGIQWTRVKEFLSQHNFKK